MFFVEINNGLVTGKGEGDFKTEEQIEVSKAIYDALINLPANYVEEGGEIVSVEPLPIPEQPPLTPTDSKSCGCRTACSGQKRDMPSVVSILRT